MRYYFYFSMYNKKDSDYKLCDKVMVGDCSVVCVGYLFKEYPKGYGVCVILRCAVELYMGLW